ncbi:MAG: metal-dependent hydrolase [Neisseria sp.]|nr:metal-dependent hydrolase [Neisseria sp.]
MDVLTDCWREIWHSPGALPYPGLLADLLRRYAEPQRHYHTAAHIAECLCLWRQFANRCARPELVGLALFYHDAVYRPERRDNESRSADYACRMLAQTRLPAADAQTVADWINATRSHRNPYPPDYPLHHDLNLLLDADLAILGAEPARFAQYQGQIRAEYQKVHPQTYRRRRRKVLQAFACRQPLFQTAWFRERFERQAKENLKTARGGKPDITPIRP